MKISCKHMEYCNGFEERRVLIDVNAKEWLDVCTYECSFAFVHRTILVPASVYGGIV